MNDVMNKDEELEGYSQSFLAFQNLLLTDEEISMNHLHIVNDILNFMKSGTKTKRKKNFKIYFENMNLSNGKELTELLQKLKTAIELNEYQEIQKQKNTLIAQGILGVTKTYLETFGEEITSQIIINHDSEDKHLHAYRRWLNEDMNSLITEMRHAYDEKTLSKDLVKQFVFEFKKYLQGRGLLKIIEINSKKIIGVPIQLTNEGYVILPHPFLETEWEVSNSIDYVDDKNRLKVGDIVSVHFKSTHNERFLASLLYVDFSSAEIVPQTLHQALVDYADESYIEKAYEVFRIEEKNEEIIKSIITKKLLDTSTEVQVSLSEQLTQLDNVREQITKQTAELNQEKEMLDEKRKEWHEVLIKIDELTNMDELEEEISKINRIPYIPEQFISTLQSLFYYNDEQHLIYKKDLIKSFVYALQANILTIIAGPSGTGKSSIVHAFANAVENVEVRMIPVQTSWTDTQDLLGYFHPMDKAFIPTPFMEAMAEAALDKNKSKLFLICLDEMNLAHVEYYFSEILSAREEKVPSLRLYPKRHWSTAKMLLLKEDVDLERQQTARELIDLYPPIFKIPKNVRFIGTLNMDHTVKPLSPKVIDRSFIIEINHLTSQEKKAIKRVIGREVGKVEMNYSIFEDAILEASLIEDTMRKIEEISALFESYPNAALNSRGLKHIRNFLSYAKNNIEKNELLDYIILGKILPRIEIKRMDIEAIAANVINQLQPYPLSLEKFRKMLNTKHTVNFW